MRGKGKKTLLIGAYATVPGTINYQGYLTDSSGDPINTGGTPLSITFSLYTVSSGGSAFWYETLPSVSVIDGVYSVILGESNSLLNEDLTPPCYLGVKVGSDPEMMPRQKLTSTAYSISANQAEFATDAGEAETLDGFDSTSFFILNQNETVSGIPSFNGGNSETQPPFYVDSSYVVQNLNAQFLGGFDSGSYLRLYANQEVLGRPSFNGGTSGTLPPFYVDSTYRVNNLNCDYLDGWDQTHFLTTATDAGRSGVVSTLYEGSASLSDRYVNETGDTITGYYYLDGGQF